MYNAILRHVATRHPSAIQPPFDTIMDEYGFEAVCAIADYLGGATVYIPSKRRIFMGCLEKEITTEFLNGATFHHLMRKYEISERHLRRMLV